MSNQHLVYGIHTVYSLLNAQSNLITNIYITPGRQDDHIRKIILMAKENNITIHRISRADMEKNLVKGKVVHQGVVATCHAFTGLKEAVLHQLLQEENKEKLLLILDCIQDPHNLGAAIRSGNAFNVTAVIAPENRACGLTPAVRKVACGAAEVTPFIQVKNLSRTMAQLATQNIWIVGLSSDAEIPLTEIDLTGNIALVLGSENQGMRKETRKHCDYLAKIPMAGEIESLNVSAAAAIALYEVLRQRSQSFIES